MSISRTSVRETNLPFVCPNLHSFEWMELICAQGGIPFTGHFCQMCLPTLLAVFELLLKRTSPCFYTELTCSFDRDLLHFVISCIFLQKLAKDNKEFTPSDLNPTKCIRTFTIQLRSHPIYLTTTASFFASCSSSLVVICFEFKTLTMPFCNSRSS